MKYIDADKLRAEIERLMDEYKPMASVDELTGAHITLAKLLSFLDTLEEPVSDDLEETARQYVHSRPFAPDESEPESTRKAFKAGAEWQKAKMLKDNPVIMSVEDFQALIDSHAKRVEADYKEKMLKEAVRGEVYKFGKVAYVKERNNAELTKYLSQFNNGDKVKIIIVKEEE